MTAAIVGVFLLRHFDADWPWYVAVIGIALLEAQQLETTRKSIMERLTNLHVALDRLINPHHYRDED